MFVSSVADRFRRRQSISDLSHQIATASPQVLARIAEHGIKAAPSDLLRHAAGDGTFRLPDDADLLSAVLLAAALPDEDHRGFAVATAFLLLDRLQEGGVQDDLYWNWDAFSDHYRLAAASMRAALMNGFRSLIATRGLYLSHPPEPSDCLTHPDFRPDIDLTPVEAGRMWAARAAEAEPLSSHERRLFRHLVEREVGMAPDQPDHCPPVPPTPQ